jgi:hypothetical protein
MINYKKLLITIVGAILLSLAVSFMLTKFVPLDIYNGTQVWIGEDPVTIPITQENYGSSVNITYTIYNVQDLYAWQLHVLYNSTKAVYEKAFFASNIFAGKPVMPIVSNLTLGNVVFGESILGKGNFSGTGTLVTVQYKLVAPVGDSVKFMFCSQKDETFLLDTCMNEIHYYYSDNEATQIPEFSNILLLILLPTSIILAISVKRRCPK